MADLVTPLSLVSNGQQTAWTAPAGKKVKSARIRWRARPDETRYPEATNTGVTSTTIPGLPTPATKFEGHDFLLSATVHNPYAYPIACRMRCEVFGSSYTMYWWWAAPGETIELTVNPWSIVISQPEPWYGQSIRILEIQAVNEQSQWVTPSIVAQSCWAKTRGSYVYQYAAATNISVFHAGVQVAGPASLANGAYSTWYNMPVELGTTSIPLEHFIGGLGEVYYQLEITYLTIKPTWVMVDGVLREVVSIHAMADGTLRQIDDVQLMVDGVPR